MAHQVKKSVMRIRRFKADDKEAAAHVVERAEKITLQPYYHKKLIDWYCEYNSAANLLKHAREVDLFLVAYRVATKDIVGLITLKGDEIERFFVDPAHQKRGIGTRLFKRLLKYARAKRLKQLRVESSLYAASVYESLGFKKKGRIKKKHAGLVYYNIAYSKQLD